MAGSFASAVGDWAEKVDGALEAVFKQACQELLSELDDLLVDMVYKQPISPSGYKRTGFLRASIMASKTAMPLLTRKNPGVQVQADFGDTVLVISSLDIGDTLFLGYTANYAAHVHYGANGRPPRPWVDMVAQRWEQIVTRVANDVRSRLGL